MRKKLIFLYGVVCYLLFVMTLVGFVAFLGHLRIGLVIDSSEQVPLIEALIVNMSLILLFGLQHSVMARQRFKHILQQFLPQAMERSTYVLAASATLSLLIWQWRSMPQTIWDIRQTLIGAALEGLFWFGLLLILIVSLLLNHADLFGLRQVYLHMRQGKYTSPGFQQHALFRLVRHPMATGTVIILWATSHMTLGHLILALGMTGYILVGTVLEERDLIDRLGAVYVDYRRRTPAFLPWWQPAHKQQPSEQGSTD